MSVKVFPDSGKITVEIPLTSPTGKMRIKSRGSLYQYGEPHPSRAKPFHPDNYLEWQISYDIAVAGGNANISTLPNVRFRSHAGAEKALFELSELFCHFVLWGIISRDETEQLANELSALAPRDFMDSRPDCRIRGGAPGDKVINRLRFMRYELKYPKFIRRFPESDAIAEVIIREKQRAVGVQPMLYFCLPVYLLGAPDIMGRHSPDDSDLTGRCARKNETTEVVFGAASRRVILELMKMFGMLSKAHNGDVVEILRAIVSHAYGAAGGRG